MKVLITLKSIDHSDKLGGIESFYKVLKSYFSDDVHYFNFSYVKSTNSLIKLYHRLRNSISFIRICFHKANGYHIILFNPSLSWSSLLRDGLFLFLASILRKKTIVFFRGWHEYMVQKIDKNRIIRFFFIKFFSKADAFIVLSAKFITQLRFWGFNQPIYIETTVVDDMLLATAKESQTHKNSGNKFNILFLARVEKAKGIFEALEAYELVKSRYPSSQLTIAGDGSILDEVKKVVRKKNLQDVSFIGYVTGEEKTKAFAGSDLYVFPSYGEGMPNSVLEAMAFGLPIITRSVGGLKDFFEDGRMGYMTESKDPKVFADMIQKLITQPELCQQMADYNAEFALSHFMASTVARRLESIYQEVLDGTATDASWRDVQISLDNMHKQRTTKQTI